MRHAVEDPVHDTRRGARRCAQRAQAVRPPGASVLVPVRLLASDEHDPREAPRDPEALTAPERVVTVTPPPQLHDPASVSEETVTTRRGRRVPPPPHTLRELRLNQSMTLRDLATKSGLNKATISQIERGRLVATQAEADQLAEALGFAPGTLQTKPMLFLVEAS